MEKCGKSADQLTADELIEEMLKFSETHVAWATICRALALTESHYHPWTNDDEKHKAHHKLQQAIKPGIKAERATRISEGFYRVKKGQQADEEA